MSRFKLFVNVAILFLGLEFLSGCQYLGGSFESAAALDQGGKSMQAIEAYQKYLNYHSASFLTPKIYYRIAKNYVTESDYTNAIIWYEKILSEYPRTDEELHALLDLADLYRDKIKNPAKAAEYNQKAFDRYVDNPQIRDAVQTLIDFQYSTATAEFVQRDYKSVDETLGNVYKTFPANFIQADTRAKVDSLADRSRRAEEIAKATVDWIVLKSEVPFNKSYDQDFPVPVKDEQVIASPDGNYLAERKRASNGTYYLYVAKISAKSDLVKFNILPQTFGAEMPAWSPDGKSLVFWQTKKKTRKLLKTDVRNKATQTLFSTDSKILGIHPAYHPAGNKIAYVYAGKVCLVDIGDAGYKQVLKTSQKLDYTADLTWSADGTMIRCHQAGKPKKTTDELLVLDVSAPNNP